jgi:ribonuclease BN (tRNA processing enzyme)
MKKLNMLILTFAGLMLLTSCQTNEVLDVATTEQTTETQVDETEEIESVAQTVEDKSVANKEKTQVNKNNQEKGQSMVSDYNFSVITVGTGTPKYSESQASASTLVQYNGWYYLVDCGDGSNRNLQDSGLSFENLKAILFTHHHIDHTTDFFDIYVKSFLANDSGINIIGPPRTEKFVEFFNEVYLDDLLYRKSNIAEVDESYKETILNYAHTSEVIDSGSFNIDGLDIQAEEMTHTMYNLAYRFEADGQSIIVSGDVSYDENLIDFAKDADILVIDGTLYTENENNQVNARNYIEPFYDYGGNFVAAAHLTFDEMVKIAVESNVSTLVITHCNESSQDRIDSSISRIKESFDGEAIYATDMLEVGINLEE